MSDLIVDPVENLCRNPSQGTGGAQLDGRRKCSLLDPAVDRTLAEPHQGNDLLEPQNLGVILSPEGVPRQR